jgi:hypothetical protein
MRLSSVMARNFVQLLSVLTIAADNAILTDGFQQALSFVPSVQKRRTSSSHRNNKSLLFALRKDIQIPLLDVIDDEELKDKFILPLPSSHLPDELTTPYIYGMQLERGTHKLIIEEAIESASTDKERVYGHIAWKVPNSSSLVGAIGVTGEILVSAPATEVFTDVPMPTTEGSNKKQIPGKISESGEVASTVLCRGCFRFVVKEVLKTIPYPVAVVDEIADDDCEEDSELFASITATDDEEDDDDDDDYSDLSTRELIQRSMLGIQAIVSQKLEDVNDKAPSPLEKAILEDTGMEVDPNAIERAQVEEMVAVWEVFQAGLVDEIAPRDRQFAIAMMAAEIANFSNEIRQEMLVSRNRDDRLRLVLRELDETVGMARARKMASQITEKVDDDEKDLKVGVPNLPPWARSIRKGTKIEYFWSEQDGWIGGTVIEDPESIVDELLLTIRFEDGEVHTIPFTGDEKVRWRPG